MKRQSDFDENLLSFTAKVNSFAAPGSRQFSRRRGSMSQPEMEKLDSSYRTKPIASKEIK